MNWDQVEGKWKQYSGKAREKWGKLTDNDFTVIAGKKDQLVGKIQERYGIAKDEAENQVDEFNRTVVFDTDQQQMADEQQEINRDKARRAGRT
jgi:uncharacterized protein YjbJ (UPF0337 family)